MKSGITKLLTGLSLISVSFLGAIPAGAAAFTNGTFSGYGAAGLTGAYDTLFVGSTAIPGWTVGVGGVTAGVGSVDWINNWWNSPGGNSIDLNGNYPGSISQKFDTTNGTTYGVSFWLAGNFDSSSYGTTRTATVSTNANDSKKFSVTKPADWAHTSMGFQLEHYVFTANSTSTTLTFTGDPNTSAWGPVLADVSVNELLASSGAQCKDFGWQTYSNPGTDVPFMNQGQCVSYFATNHDVPIGSLNSSGLS